MTPRTYTDEQLTPRLLASHLDLYRRATASAQVTRGDISKTQVRLNELEKHLIVLEEEIEEATEFCAAYLIKHQSMD